jgi:hypothetical protein
MESDVVAPGPPASGAFPSWDEAFGWAASDADWVPLTSGWGWHKDIELKLALLLDAGIPACLHDRPFGELFGWPWGQIVPTAILVAPQSFEDARALLDAPFPDRDGEFAAAGPELDGLRKSPFYRAVRALLWAWVVSTLVQYVFFLPGFAGIAVLVLLPAVLLGKRRGS